jgi:hypothetical protein
MALNDWRPIRPSPHPQTHYQILIINVTFTNFVISGSVQQSVASVHVLIVLALEVTP